ncbi:MAG: hypothetical protein FWG58_04335 [Methanomassiliicoccaceae archaeon]|nr:hypothetical protein [Methanomassiliicoccaceae archaeon]
MATLLDYQHMSVPEPDKFYGMYKNLKPEEYRAKIIETYGPAAGRDKKVEAMVNAAVLAYLLK